MENVVMEKKIVFSMLLCVILFAAACSSMKVTVNYDQDASFGDYKTFQFVSPKRQQQAGGRAIANPLFTKEVLREMRPIFESKGLTQATTMGEADILVVFYAAIKNRRDFVAPTYRVGRWGRVHRTSPGHVVNYKEGTLVIDIVDREKKELVWQGVGKGVLDRDNPGKNLVEAVQQVLEKFPPQ